MAKRISVEMTTKLFVDDERAMREAGYERLKEAWSGDEDFPYDDADGVPLEAVVNSLLADALPLALPGCRRGRLDVEAGEVRQVADAPDDSAEAADDAGNDEDSGDDRGSGAPDTDDGQPSDPEDAGSRRSE